MQSKEKAMTKDEALDKALDKALYALEIEDAACRYMKDETPSQIVEAITAIKQARSAPVQEPEPACWQDEDSCPNRQACCDAQQCLYTTPPAAQRQWVGLTKEETEWCTAHRHLIEWANDKLKEKNT
jgi:hypothetical protein